MKAGTGGNLDLSREYHKKPKRKYDMFNQLVDVNPHWNLLF